MTWTALGMGIEVLRIAQHFVDMHEVQPNKAWSRPVDSEALRELMRETGWQDGWPYCASFTEACVGTGVRVLGDPKLEALVRRKFTPSVMQTYNNVKKYVHRNRPLPGAIFFMQKGNSALGHEGLVILAGERTMATIEGNTSPGVVVGAKDREGDGIYLKIRPITFDVTQGLHLLGFLDPIDSSTAALLHEA